jgi:hypothetical protein
VTQPGAPDAPPAGAANVVATRLERLAQIAAELGDHVLAADARADHDRLVEARFFVACLGQFKRGKSTLLNALVGEPILPVGVVPVTSVVTILRYGDPRAAIVHFSDGHTELIALDAIAMFIDERQNPGNRRQAAIVDVALPSPILRDGLCLVDTPGLGFVHLANTEATRAFVPHTDVALVVVGPDPPISGAELQLIEEVSREAGELMVILNKGDQASAEQLREVSEFTRTTVEKALTRPISEILQISALERINQHQPTRDWPVLETHLKRLSSQTRQHLVDTAGVRSIRRLSRRLASELAQRDDALRKPVDPHQRPCALMHHLDRQRDSGAPGRQGTEATSVSVAPASFTPVRWSMRSAPGGPAWRQWTSTIVSQLRRSTDRSSPWTMSCARRTSATSHAMSTNSSSRMSSTTSWRMPRGTQST